VHIDLSVQASVNVVKEISVRRLRLEPNNTCVAAKLQAVDRDRSIHGPLVEEIKDKLRSFDKFWCFNYELGE
jgi:hypothetical protein